MIGFDPTDEQALIVETVRGFVENEVRPRSRECDEAASLTKDVLSQAHELGLVANSLPEAHGGGGERSVEQAAARELSILHAAEDTSPRRGAPPLSREGPAHGATVASSRG